ncbi:hypothetical protein [Halalkalibacter oceani]|uniref:hypothetical protein n=1 Tax=Halalkalibacter oceani TaxID=1653776 RepID=UPI003398A40D
MFLSRNNFLIYIVKQIALARSAYRRYTSFNIVITIIIIKLMARCFRQNSGQKEKKLASVIEKNEKVVILEISEKEMFLYGTSYGRGGEIIYNELGLRAPVKVEEIAFEAGWAGMTLEVLPEYLAEADYLLLGVRELGEENKKDIQNSPLWQNLPAVQVGCVMKYDLDSFYFQDPIALEQQLDETAAFLLSKQQAGAPS